MGTDTDKLIKNFPYINIPKLAVDTDWWSFRKPAAYDWYYADVLDKPGITGQANDNPSSLFSNYQFVEMTIGGVTSWYDPSYGRVYEGDSLAARQLTFDNQAISGYGVFCKVFVKEAALGDKGVDLNGNGVATDTVWALVLLLRKNELGGTPEVKISTRVGY